MFEEFTLAASTADLADAETATAREHADVVEFRLDLAPSPLTALDDYDGPLPLLVTNRPEWEGGAAPAGEQRFDALETALDHDAVVAVDLELAALRRHPRTIEVAEAARERDVAVVASVHDFSGTPSERTLSLLLDAATRAGDVGKVAVTAHDRADALRLLAATHAAAATGQRVATMAMGEPGRHTRAVAPLYGSRLGYAPVDPAEATAPGQYDLATLAELVERLAGNPEA